MKSGKKLHNIAKISAWTLWGLCMVVCVALTLLYSSWSQEYLRHYVVEAARNSGMQIALERLSLSFPLDIEAGGVEIAADGMNISADALKIDVGLLPLLGGNAAVDGAVLEGAKIEMGTPEEAMYMTMSAPKLAINHANVELGKMKIDIDKVDLAGGDIALTLKPDTVAKPAAEPSEPTKMAININSLALQNFAYRMRMLPTIDSLGVVIPQALGEQLSVDLAQQTIDLKSLAGRSMNLSYIAPDEATVAATPLAAPSESESKPWTISIAGVDFENSQALYTTRGVVPVPGLDFAYISVAELALKVEDFYNRAAELRVPLRLSAKERCGVELEASGVLEIDEKALAFSDFEVTTPNATELAFSGLLGMGAGLTDPSTALALDLDGFIANRDAKLMFPAFEPYLSTLPARSRFYAGADIEGTAGRLNINDLTAIVDGNAQMSLRGMVENAFDFANIGGYLDIEGDLMDINPVVGAFTEQVNVPRTVFDGRADMNRGSIKGKLQARTEQGRLSLDADWNSRHEDYTLAFMTDSFPVNAFMPLMGIGEISMNVNAAGHGYDLFSTEMQLDADIDLMRAVYNGYDYKGIKGKASIADGMAQVNMQSANRALRFNLDAAGNLASDTYDWNVNLAGVHADLLALGMSTEECKIDAQLSAQASVEAKDMSAQMQLGSLTYTDRLGSFTVDDVYADFAASDSLCTLFLNNRDLEASLSSRTSLDGIIAAADSAGAMISKNIAAHRLDIDSLQLKLPPFDADIRAGHNNLLNRALAHNGMGFRELNMRARNDSSLRMEAKLLGLETTSMRLDSIALKMRQNASVLDFEAQVDNRPGTLDRWAYVALKGSLSGNRLDANLRQRNIAGEEGYSLGMVAMMSDSVMMLSFTPATMTIAYKPWTINEDNFVSWSFKEKQLDADLRMQSLVSSLDIYTARVPGSTDGREELYVNLSNIQLADWINVSPFAPPMEGSVYASLGIGRESEGFRGHGAFSIVDLYYDRRRVGTVDTEFNVSTDLGGRVRANADLSLDDHKAVTLSGALNDTTATSPMSLDLAMLQFPLSSVNPFLPANMARLSGTLNGSMAVLGTVNAPMVNGWLQFDSTAVNVDMLGAAYSISSTKIPVDDNVIRFDNLNINGTNNQPLGINGSVSLKDITSPEIDLALHADNFQICNTSRAAKGAEIYGKGFVGTNTTIRGNMDFIQVKSTFNVLSGTNLTYIMTDAESVITGQSTGDMVKFVNFNDTIDIVPNAARKEGAMAMIVDAVLSIRSGSTISVDLSADGKNKVRVQPEGTVNFSMMPFSDPRLTGRVNINSGFVRYTPPFMSEKHFDFTNNSYVAFNGEMMNPSFGIHAVDQVKANVTQSGQNSRLVNFNVGLDITGTLENMNVAFDLSTDDDITVANELQSMSAEQRANQAMNMLLYGMYTGPGTSTDGNFTGNALNSFLASRLNSWAANTIKGVDLTFGIDSYNQTTDGTTSSTTNYSYQVSKTLFNDRFKIVVGGNYSTDADNDENFSQNLINDISFEYFLNSAQTMSVKLFRHTGYESILEGEITKTGVGFVYKRKLATLRNIFRFGRSPRKTPENETK